MRMLFIGSSSNLCRMLISKFKNKKIFTVSTKRLNTDYFIKDYSEKNIEKLSKFLLSKKSKFDRIVFFNGYHQLSTLRYINPKLFFKIYKINILVPLIFVSCLTKYNLVKQNGSFIFIGSIASELNEIGNSYYSSAKFTLKKVILLLKKEIKFFRFNLLSLGLIKNSMSEKLINKLPSKNQLHNKYLDNKKIINIFDKVLKDNKSNGKVFKYYGKYKIKN